MAIELLMRRGFGDRLWRLRRNGYQIATFENSPTGRGLAASCALALTNDGPVEIEGPAHCVRLMGEEIDECRATL